MLAKIEVAERRAVTQAGRWELLKMYGARYFQFLFVNDERPCSWVTPAGTDTVPWEENYLAW